MVEIRAKENNCQIQSPTHTTLSLIRTTTHNLNLQHCQPSSSGLKATNIIAYGRIIQLQDELAWQVLLVDNHSIWDHWIIARTDPPRYQILLITGSNTKIQTSSDIPIIKTQILERCDSGFVVFFPRMTCSLGYRIRLAEYGSEEKKVEYHRLPEQ